MRILVITTFLTILSLTNICASAQSADDRYPIVKNGKVGFIDYQGNEVIPARFGNVGGSEQFEEGLAPVWGLEGGGYIDPSGKFVIGPQKEWSPSRPFH